MTLKGQGEYNSKSDNYSVKYCKKHNKAEKNSVVFLFKIALLLTTEISVPGEMYNIINKCVI